MRAPLPSRRSDLGALALLMLFAIGCALELAFVMGLFGRPWL